MLYKTDIDSPAMFYGRTHEAEAVRCLEAELGVKVRRCGLFIDHHLPYLAASPDGIIDDHTIVEVKCPFTAQDLSPTEAIQQGKVDFWRVVGDSWEINKRHNYYYQVSSSYFLYLRF